MENRETKKKDLTPKSKNTPRWYTEVIQKANLADYGPVRGTMIIKPYGYSIWEYVQREFDKLIQKLGVENAYFPLFIPLSLFKKEKEHVKGFSPELAIVTHGGGKKLDEPLAVRPTSETIMYYMYSKWISSWRDLPLKINQWNNVVRWEKRTYFFLRTLEFLWQEGHTAHATFAEAENMALDALAAYETLYQDTFALKGVTGIKSEAEKFAGADHTFSIELLMSDNKILQAATSHHLGDNFSKVFDIKFQDKDGKTKYVFQTSWGLSTRSIGGLILIHGDDDGLVLPPRLAPLKVIIIPVLGKKDENILKYCQRIKEEIESKKSIFPGKVVVDADQEKSYGWKVNEAEIKGIPLRISVGVREMEEKTLTVDSRNRSLEKKLFRLESFGSKVEEILTQIQQEMLSRSEKLLNENIREAKTYAGFKEIMATSRGFIIAPWCGRQECEQKIKKETKASTRVKLLSSIQKGKKNCIYCGKGNALDWYFGQSY